MNSLWLGRNRHLLTPILALLLMNVPVTEAKIDWSEGTNGTFAMVGWILLTMATFSAMVGTMVYGYRTLFGHRAISEEEYSRQLRESQAWLSQIAWIRVGLPTDRATKRAAAARVLDLERQFFGVPSPSRPLLCTLFSCLFPSKLFARLFRAVKNGFSTLISSDKSINENNRRNKGKAPERRYIREPKTSTADGAKSATTKDGGENATHDFTSSKQTTDIPCGRAQQRVLAPPPKAHEAISSSKHAKTPKEPAASPRDHTTSSIAAVCARDPVRPTRKPLPSSKHVESPITGPTGTSRHGHVVSPIAALYALDPIRPTRNPLPSSHTMPYPYHA